ncbi:EI24 domain-containing protein [Massilia sp. DWR3-1-1]|uniref:EI24 domain-containing protein n=1 Tax=Massilia sp. DWR3-1-1 TaxID=2804559 RepID=UPI003CFACD35
MRAVLDAFGRALASQFSGRMLLLSVLPCLLSVALWAALLYVGFQPLVDAVQVLFAEHGAYAASAGMLAMFGMGVLKTVVVPLVAMLLLLPLMIFTALLFMGLAAMPAIGRHVAARQASRLGPLEKKAGGSLAGSLATSLGALAIFVVLWLISLPLYLLPPLFVVAQVLLWGWLTARVMAYDALAEFASVDERRVLLRQHRKALLAIGMVSGVAGALPGLAWIGGALISVLLFPVLAIVSIWLYVVIFIFTGLWFQHYLLTALHVLRSAAEQGERLDASGPGQGRSPLPN